jgi:Tfp pilus assembly protein PilO
VEFPWPAVGIGAGWGAFVVLCMLVLRAVVKGDWIPRVTHERELDKAEHDANEWRAEGRIKDQAILVELGHVREQTEEIGNSLHNFIASLQKATGVASDTPDES